MILQCTGGVVTEETVEVEIPQWAWRTGMGLTLYLLKTELAVRLHGYEVLHSEEPFELQGLEGTVSEIV